MRVHLASSVAFSSAVRLDTEYGFGLSFCSAILRPPITKHYLANTFRISACFFSR